MVNVDSIPDAHTCQSWSKLILVGIFQSAAYCMGKAGGRESRDYAGLIGGDPVLPIISLTGNCHRLGCRRESTQRRNDGRPMRLVVSGLVPQRQAAAEVVL